MNSLQWIELYDAFEKFAELAKKQRLFPNYIDEMRNYFFEHCPMPARMRPQKQ